MIAPKPQARPVASAMASWCGDAADNNCSGFVTVASIMISGMTRQEVTMKSPNVFPRPPARYPWEA